MSRFRIVEWSQSLYADMPQKCWTVVDENGNDMAGTFWDKPAAERFVAALIAGESAS